MSDIKAIVVDEQKLAVTAGAQGPSGPAGPPGADGAAGPNTVTTATTTDLTGILTGDGSNAGSTTAAAVVGEYLTDDGIHTLTSSSGVCTPDASNGRSQKFPLTEDVTDFNPPTNLGDGQSMLIQVLQDATPRSLTLDAAWVIIGSGVAADIASLASGEYAWLSITRYGSAYLISITAQT